MNTIYTGEKDTRLYKNVLGETIAQILDHDPYAVYLDADLMNCISTAKLPGKTDRAIDCGIAEANMIGIACGLSSVCMHPIKHTFCPFASRRSIRRLCQELCHRHWYGPGRHGRLQWRYAYAVRGHGALPYHSGCHHR